MSAGAGSAASAAVAAAPAASETKPHPQCPKKGFGASPPEGSAPPKPPLFASKSMGAPKHLPHSASNCRSSFRVLAEELSIYGLCGDETKGVNNPIAWGSIIAKLAFCINSRVNEVTKYDDLVNDWKAIEEGGDDLKKKVYTLIRSAQHKTDQTHNVIIFWLHEILNYVKYVMGETNVTYIWFYYYNDNVNGSIMRISFVTTDEPSEPQSLDFTTKGVRDKHPEDITSEEALGKRVEGYGPPDDPEFDDKQKKIINAKIVKRTFQNLIDKDPSKLTPKEIEIFPVVEGMFKTAEKTIAEKARHGVQTPPAGGAGDADVLADDSVESPTVSAGAGAAPAAPSYEANKWRATWGDFNEGEMSGYPRITPQRTDTYVEIVDPEVLKRKKNYKEASKARLEIINKQSMLAAVKKVFIERTIPEDAFFKKEPESLNYIEKILLESGEIGLLKQFKTARAAHAAADQSTPTATATPKRTNSKGKPASGSASGTPAGDPLKLFSSPAAALAPAAADTNPVSPGSGPGPRSGDVILAELLSADRASTVRASDKNVFLEHAKAMRGERHGGGKRRMKTHKKRRTTKRRVTPKQQKQPQPQKKKRNTTVRRNRRLGKN